MAWIIAGALMAWCGVAALVARSVGGAFGRGWCLEESATAPPAAASGDASVEFPTPRSATSSQATPAAM